MREQVSLFEAGIKGAAVFSNFDLLYLFLDMLSFFRSIVPVTTILVIFVSCSDVSSESKNNSAFQNELETILPEGLHSIVLYDDFTGDTSSFKALRQIGNDVINGPANMFQIYQLNFSNDSTMPSSFGHTSKEYQTARQLLEERQLHYKISGSGRIRIVRQNGWNIYFAGEGPTAFLNDLVILSGDKRANYGKYVMDDLRKVELKDNNNVYGSKASGYSWIYKFPDPSAGYSDEEISRAEATTIVLTILQIDSNKKTAITLTFSRRAPNKTPESFFHTIML